MEQFDKATFAQVPLRLTGDASHPVEVRPDADGDYSVGSLAEPGGSARRCSAAPSPLRFGRGEPFHAGTFWRGMEAGLGGCPACSPSSAPSALRQG